MPLLAGPVAGAGAAVGAATGAGAAVGAATGAGARVGVAIGGSASAPLEAPSLVSSVGGAVGDATFSASLTLHNNSVI